MAGPDVNRKWKVYKEISLYSDLTVVIVKIHLLYFFPATLKKLINILSLKMT